MHSTNYYDTFIGVAEDCPVSKAEIPPLKGDRKTIANIQFELVSKNPYKFTSDDVLFSVFATRKDIAADNLEKERTRFFSKGQPCFRSSPLTKRYGWGVHSNNQGRIALFALDSKEYQEFIETKNLQIIKAMRTKKG